MRIIYVTTSITGYDFENAVKDINFNSNPSNQNFHHALIRACASYMNVDVVSSANALLSFKKDTVSEDYIKYHYLKSSKNKFLHYFSLKHALNSKLKQLIGKDKDVMIIVDGMNISLTSTCLSFAKKHHIKIIGILTDNPNLLSNVKKIYIKKVLQNAAKFDGYICLTKALNELMNVNKKPFSIIDGVYEKRELINSHLITKDPYIFFGGSLYSKYGVKTLINAFLNSDVNARLIIAGAGPLQEYIVKKSIRTHHTIIYLSTLSQAELQYYQNHAIININPRPFTKEMDDYCIPSKVFEYAGSNAITISTHHTRLKEAFGDSIIWTKDNEFDMAEAIEKVFAMTNEEKEKIVNSAHEVINKNYTISEVGKKIVNLIKNIA